MNLRGADAAETILDCLMRGLARLSRDCDYADARLSGGWGARITGIDGLVQPLGQIQTHSGIWCRLLAGSKVAAGFAPVPAPAAAEGDDRALEARVEAAMGTAVDGALSILPRVPETEGAWIPGPQTGAVAAMPPTREIPLTADLLPAICSRVADLSAGGTAIGDGESRLTVDSICLAQDRWTAYADTAGTRSLSRSPWLHVLHGASAGDAYFGRQAGGRSLGSAFSEDSVRRLRTAERVAAELAGADRLPSDLDYDYLLLDHDLLGLVVHEAVGHALEGDHVLDGSSPLGRTSGRLWESELPFDIIATPLMPNCGFHPVDDEGTPGREVVLVAGGWVREYLHTRETAVLLGGEPNGHGFAAAYHQPVLSRMTSIYLRPRTMVAELPAGWDHRVLAEFLVTRGVLRPGQRALYLMGWNGGHATWSNLSFRVDVAAACLMEPGRPPRLFHQGLLTGDARAMLGGLVHAFGPLQVDTAGYCWKEGQLLLTSDGGPAVTVFRRVDGVSVRG